MYIYIYIYIHIYIYIYIYISFVFYHLIFLPFEILLTYPTPSCGIRLRTLDTVKFSFQSNCKK